MKNYIAVINTIGNEIDMVVCECLDGKMPEVLFQCKASQVVIVDILKALTGKASIPIRLVITDTVALAERLHEVKLPAEAYITGDMQ